MKPLGGFVWLPLLILAGLIILGGGTYWYTHRTLGSSGEGVRINILSIKPQPGRSPLVTYEISGTLRESLINLIRADDLKIYWWDTASVGVHAIDLTGQPRKSSEPSTVPFPEGNYFFKIERSGDTVATSSVFHVPSSSWGATTAEEQKDCIYNGHTYKSGTATYTPISGLRVICKDGRWESTAGGADITADVEKETEVTIDTSSLDSSSSNPTLSGSVSPQITDLEISIFSYDPKTHGGDEVWGSGNTTVAIKNGKWSVRIEVPGAATPWRLTPGTYQVLVDGRPRNDPYAGFYSSNYKPLRTGILTIKP